MSTMYRLGWFSTGRGETSRDLLRAMQDKVLKGDIDARIEFVFVNREPGQAESSDLFMEFVKQYGIPLVYLGSRDFEPDLRRRSIEEWRSSYDRAVMDRIGEYRPDLCVLAGYKLVMSQDMCQQYKIINLHPAAPDGPSGTWQEVIWSLIETRASRTGAMMHLVTPELDRGPVVTYCKFPITGGPFDRHWREVEERSLALIREQQGENNALFKLIRQRGVVRELPLITATIKAFSQGLIRIEGQRVLDDSGSFVDGYDLTSEINALVSE